MKLYININGQNIQSTENITVVGKPGDAIINKFYFELIKGIVKGVMVPGIDKVKEKSLITDFEAYNEKAFSKIMEQWNLVKQVLLGENPVGTHKVMLPQEYVEWLYNHGEDAYNQIAPSLEGRGNTVEISIEKIYTNAIGQLVRKIEPKEYSLLVVNDELVDDDSKISKDTRDRVGDLQLPFMSFIEWKEQNEVPDKKFDNPSETRAERNMDNQQEENSSEKKSVVVNWDELFPVYGVTLGETNIRDISERLGLSIDSVCDKTRLGEIQYSWLKMPNCSLAQYQDVVHKIVLYSFPKKWNKLFGFSIGSLKTDVEREMIFRKAKTQYRFGTTVWYLITSDDKYTIRMDIEDGEMGLNEIEIGLNRCPYCGSYDFDDDHEICDDHRLHIVCNNCGRVFYA